MAIVDDFNQQILEALPDQLYILDKDQVVHYVNPAMVTMLSGMNLPYDLIGHKFSAIFPGTLPYLQDEIDLVYSTRQPLRVEHTVEVAGEMVSYETVRIPMLNSAGEVTKILNSIHNVTSYLKIQKDLQESRRMFETMVDNANSIILRMNLDGRVTYLNKFAESFFGFTREELVGQPVQSTIVPNEDSEGNDLKRLINSILENPHAYTSNENENICKDGSRVWISWSNKPVADDKGVINEILCVGNDITLLKRTQIALVNYNDRLEETIKQRTRELQDSEARYRYLFEESPTLSAVISIDGIIIDLNNTMAENLGFTRKEMIGRKVIEFIIRDGKTTPSVPNLYNPDEKNIDGVDVCFRAKDGTDRIYRITGHLDLRKDSAVVAKLICGIDITEELKLKAQQRQHEEKMIQTDRLASLGTLVSGVAHEINNPNNFIALNADNLQAIWKDVSSILDIKASDDQELKIAGLPYCIIRDEMEHLIDAFRSGSKRIRTIVTHLKEFARQGPLDMNQDVDCTKVLEAAQIIVANLIKKSTAKFSVTIKSTHNFVKGDFQKLEQVIINLLTNACQALTSREQAISVTLQNNIPANTIELIVRDEGMGISAEQLPHIFDPFFTTKRESGGTGLGLSISYGIIKDHKGTLDVVSSPGKGTTFTITLPVHSEV